MNSIQKLLENLLNSSGHLGILNTAVAIVLAYVGGLLASLTPCVYPMIPITMSVVGGVQPHHLSKKAWHHLLVRALAYVLGMATVYSFLGVIAGLSGRIFGSLTNTSAWYLFLGFVMTVASLLMLEVISFDPLAIWNRIKYFFTRRRASTAHQKPPSHKGSIMGAFGLGISSGFIAAPCTTPVLTSVLAYIAQTQSVFLGFALMVSFSLGLGTILMAVAVFAGSLQMLPRSGAWMKTVKVLSGVLLLGFAEYLIYKSGQLGGQ